jgi:2-amino-4-hydroxy-6-hydroxymethyldihydropteridine diphosphokinase
MKTGREHTEFPDQVEQYFLSLGSNLSVREFYLYSAVDELSKFTQVGAISSIYETEAWGPVLQNDYLNVVCSISCSLSPQTLFQRLVLIEGKLGRQRRLKWEPRIIDIDILFAGQQVIEEPGLKIPHPLLHQRKFVLVPLSEIAPGFIHPGLKKSCLELLRDCKDNGKVILFKKWG